MQKQSQPLLVNNVWFERSDLIPNFVGTVTFEDEQVLTIGPFFSPPAWATMGL